VTLALLAVTLLLALAAAAFADVPGRVTPPAGGVPNPGTQEQELGNITLPAPYNVYEFVVTCGACHAGTVDQNAAHFGNWAGSSMASSARDPVFRANEIIVNNAIQGALGGEDGAGNVCFRCHSPNGWGSGRFNPALNGAGDGRFMEHSILLSTDDEGILCEFCHRSMGQVTMKRKDLNPSDPAWNMLAGISDWPHQGDAYPLGPLEGNPYGDNTMQIADGMTYGGPYSGTVMVHYGDQPLELPDPLIPVGPGNVPIMDPTLMSYTGQTYGVYPPGWQDAEGNDVGGQVAINPDGNIPLQFEEPIGPPAKPGGGYDYQAQAMSLEHPTFKDDFLTSSEFCGSCHDLTGPVLNHGMPEQRTYTEWKYSDFGTGGAKEQRCQDCHMPRMKHEYSDQTQVSLNADPVLSGYFPYGKNRNANGGTAFHKFAGANDDLQDMMTMLYPEVDLQVIGAPTGNDTRVFPGMMSDRSSMWERSQRNTELALQSAADVSIVSLKETAAGKYELQVKVQNTTGHRIPSGYPDGRRAFLSVAVRNTLGGATVYESGYYDPETAYLYTDSAKTPLQRALSPTIDAADNAVMVYERATGTKDPDGSYTESTSLLNDTILFDNRIPPSGFEPKPYQQAGTFFITYDDRATKVPREDASRYPAGQGYDLVTYTFSAAPGLKLAAHAELQWQTHTREFMEHLKESDTSTLRPQGPPSVYDPNYPLTPNYLSDVIALDQITDLDGAALRDNWGGIAYAAWVSTDKGAPTLVDAADTGVTRVPAAPQSVRAVTPDDPETGLRDPFSLDVSWSRSPGATGYVLWVRYGVADATASWDRLKVLRGNASNSYHHQALNVNKTYTYRVQAFNEAGISGFSQFGIGQTPWDLPLGPMNLAVVPPVRAFAATLSWYDQDDNEIGFIIERQDVPVVADFVEIARIDSPHPGGFGGVTWTDTTVQPSTTYNYRVRSFNGNGTSGATLPVTLTTPGIPRPASGLTAAALNAYQVDLAWTDNAGNESGFRVQRRTGAGWVTIASTAADTVAYSDTTTFPSTAYVYRVIAYNGDGDGQPSNEAAVVTPVAPPLPPSRLAGTPYREPTRVILTWVDGSTDETGFRLYRADALTPAVWLQVGSVAAGVTTFTDTTAQPKWTYLYRATAVGAGGESAASAPITVVTLGEPPEQPVSFRISGRTQSSLSLAWSDTSTNEQGFTIQRRRLGGTFTTVRTTGADVTRWTSTGLRSKTTYQFRMRAFNADGTSAWTPVVTGTTR
jgi:fibronectin type 3 domain-containing protein